MKILYDSRTGNVRRFLKDANIEATQITEDMIVDEPFILVTYTTGWGKPPEKVLKFLEKNHQYLIGISASGDKNWGRENFAASADYICNLYKNVALISKFEKRGTQKDREQFLKGVEILYERIHHVKQ